MNATKPAVSPAALPTLLADLEIEVARCGWGEVYTKICGHHRVNLERQIEAANTGAESWTDTNGTIWGAGGLMIGGTKPKPGISHDSCLELYGYVPAPL